MAGDYIIQKAVEASKVKKGYLLPLNEYEQQAKYDGCCAILKFGKGGRYLGAWSRTGEEAVSMKNIGDRMYTAYGQRLEDTAFIGEAWWPGKGEFNKISGEFRTQKPSDKLLFVINDAIPLVDFENGECRVPYIERVCEWRNSVGLVWFFAENWLPGHGCPQERCNQLVKAGGFDGLILRKQDGFWKVGRGTTGEIIKVKQKLSFDLRVLEVNTEVGEKTGRDVYKLVVDFRGKRLGVGSGLPHKREEVPNVGDIVEVEAMDYSSDGLLREPRYKGVRFDKVRPD